MSPEHYDPSFKSKKLLESIRERFSDTEHGIQVEAYYLSKIPTTKKSVMRMQTDMKQQELLAFGTLLEDLSQFHTIVITYQVSEQKPEEGVTDRDYLDVLNQVAGLMEEDLIPSSASDTSDTSLKTTRSLVESLAVIQGAFYYDPFAQTEEYRRFSSRRWYDPMNSHNERMRLNFPKYLKKFIEYGSEQRIDELDLYFFPPDLYEP